MSKNLHDLSDEEFDDLFRESAEKSGIGFDPEAWNKMSQKLDAANTPPLSPGKGGNPLKKWILPAMIVLLLLITGTYFLVRKPSGAVTEKKGNIKENSVKQTDKVGEKDVATDKVDTENQENAKESAISSDKVQPEAVIQKDAKTTTKALKLPAEAESPIIKPNKRATTENSAIETQSTNQSKKPFAGKVKNAKFALTDKSTTDYNKNDAAQISQESPDLAITKNKTNTIITKVNTKAKSKLPILPENKQDNANGLTKNKTQRDALRDSHTSDKTDDISANNVVNPDAKTTPQSQDSSGDSVYNIEKMQWISIDVLSPNKHPFVIDLKLPNIRFESPMLAPVTIPRANTAFRKGLNIRLALSPDLSFIPSNKIFKVGSNWAAILEYRFNNRFSIQTGVIRSMKYYGALPSQYEWNVYWAMPSPLKDIDAKCKMLDIPLNVRYDLSQKTNSRWFVGGGFTSYIMLKEEYRYNYENPADPNIKRTSWEGKTGGYPFSVLNLSMGYERQFLRRLTFQAEPFYKAPLGKVGYGKVRLATAGVFFSVKYPF
ncbi:hypothetical protein [Emticicia sp. BO119]|uniref:hypothetical protein n=1 Tax=Emticicia sp. BO119 TaxID=2757768 RepID=UPI0015F05C24|nr:hypothetical protein [Emticicia sp. BO119]MBA4850907.1 hypothetical protein [Emticicia sp. BO119]